MYYTSREFTTTRDVDVAESMKYEAYGMTQELATTTNTFRTTDLSLSANSPFLPGIQLLLPFRSCQRKGKVMAARSLNGL